MQALSVWPSRSESWRAPRLEFELGLSSNSSSRKQKTERCEFSHSFSYIRSSGLLFFSSHLGRVKAGGCFRSRGCDLGCKFSPKCSALKVQLFCKPKRSALGTSSALAWALEEQAVGSDDTAEENSNLLTGVSVKVENKSVRPVQFQGVGEGGFSHGDIDGTENCTNTEEKVEKEKSAKIDVRALARSLHTVKTADDVKQVLKDKGELPLQVYSSVIRGFGKDNKLDSAMALVQWLKAGNQAMRPNLFIYNSLLGAVKQAGRYDLVEKVIDDMATEDVHPNVVTYNTLMAIYIEQGREIEALGLFEEIPEKGLSPTPASYSTALLAYRRLEDGFGAVKFYVELKNKYQKGEIGNDADEDWKNEYAKLEDFSIRICYQVIRRWLVKTENLSTDVLRLLTEMDKAGLQTSRSELERLAWACTRPEHHVVGKELYNRIRERDAEISLSVCNHVIWLMGKAKKWWAALEIYEDLLDKGPKPNNMSYELVVSHFNILLAAARKRGIWRWGVRLLNKMEEKGLKPGSKEWNSVLIACSKASETTAAVQIFKRMVEQGEQPTVISYGALLSALEKGKLYDEALQVWKHMVKMGVEPNLYAYTIMASIYTAQGKFNIVDSIIREMSTSGVQPTVVTFNAIISGCARNNMGSAAYEWFQRMKVHSIYPNEVTYEMLIEALTNDGKPRVAYELYLRAQNEGLILSSKAYDAVIHSSQVYGATVDVSTLGPRPPEKKKKMLIRKNLSEFCNLADVPRRSRPFDRKEIYTVQTEEIP